MDGCDYCGVRMELGRQLLWLGGWGDGRMWPRRKVGKSEERGGVGGVSWCHRAEVEVVVKD
jgi:hypothetical protein